MFYEKKYLKKLFVDKFCLESDTLWLMFFFVSMFALFLGEQEIFLLVGNFILFCLQAGDENFISFLCTNIF